MTDDDSEVESEDPRARMERALRQIRREGWKAAFVHAVVEAVAVFLVTNLALSMVDPDWLPAELPVPATLTAPVADTFGWSGPVTIPGPVVVASGLAVLVFGGGLWLRVKRPLVDQFEAVNPAVTEALRTARDAVDDDADSRMASRLYEDVLERLRETSSHRLLHVRRIGVTILVVAALSLATVQVSVYDITLSDSPSVEGTTAPEEEATNFSGLQDADAVLGDRENVTVGDENLTAKVESTGGDEDIEDRSQFPGSGGTSDGSGIGSTDSQQAGFASPEQIEDAKLIREYNIRIRKETQEN